MRSPVILASAVLVLAPVAKAQDPGAADGGAEDAGLSPARDASPDEDAREVASPLAARVETLERRIRELEARLETRTEQAPDRERARVRPGDAAENAVDAAPTEGRARPPFTIGGWVEAYYAWNFNEPDNGITDLRGFDNRHHSFNLSNVAVDARWDLHGAHGRITLQWGSTPATYYLAETDAPGAGSGVGAQSAALWQMIQQANIGYRVPIGDGLDVSAGLFLSPCGAEGMNVKDNWFYSRSNLFFGYPFYHTGLRLSYPVTPELSVVAWIVNGWNTVLDVNDEKSVMLQGTLSTDEVSGSLMYMAGVERPEGAPEGRAWRHLVDLNATVTATEWLALQGQITGSVEPNSFGTSGSLAGALAVRVRALEWLFVSARGDFFWEEVATDATGSASAIYWPVEWVSAATLSVEVRPHEHASLRVEYRHDHAAGLAYFRGAVDGNGTAATPFARNATTQDTLTIGATGWF